MRREMKPLPIGLLLAALVAFPALAQMQDQQGGDNTRSVRIIEAPVAGPAVSPTEPSLVPVLPAEDLPQLSLPSSPEPTPQAAAPPPNPPLPDVVPSAPAAALVPQVPVAPAATAPASELVPQVPAAPTATAVAPSPLPDAVSPSYKVMSVPQSGKVDSPTKRVDLGALESSIKVANPAEISIEILPSQEFAAGARVSFRVSTKKAGYLILLDVDAAGKLTQIYPNLSSLTLTAANQQNANYVKPGKAIQIPNPAEARSFEFIASPPFGTAMVVAFLSDKPVQMVDLPDVPASITGQAAALTFLTKLAGDLRIPQGNDGVRMEAPQWSFDAKFYAIR